NTEFVTADEAELLNFTNLPEIEFSRVLNVKGRKYVEQGLKLLNKSVELNPDLDNPYTTKGE
ncbi:MAG: hypothetical protein B7Z06_09470, partial [Flavobacteriales bacterium 32-35-8]